MKRICLGLVITAALLVLISCGSSSMPETEQSASHFFQIAEPAETETPEETKAPLAIADKPDRLEETGKSDLTDSPFADDVSEPSMEPECVQTAKPEEDIESDLVSDVTWFGSSTYKVGVDLDAGEYFIKSNEDGRGYFKVSEDSAGDSIIMNDTFSTHTFVTVEDGQYFQIKRSEMTLAKDVEPLAEDGIISDGMYRVGIDIPAGEYKATATSDRDGYYSVRSDSVASNNRSILFNDVFEGNAFFTVSEGQYLCLNRCDAVLQN